MTCNKCNKQYTSQATGHFLSIWNNYNSKSRSFDRGEQYMEEYLHKHFESEHHSHFRYYVFIILIGKTDDSKPTKRETYWIRTLKTIAPYGLNVENGVYLFYFDVRDVWRQGIYLLFGHLQDLDFGMLVFRTRNRTRVI